ncbi:UNVERIFIED_CONTAM: hypothetical protein Sangu_3153600 [Sesamum angustifolium]|uniref:Uncharacterized protein n=1 Tax=Sesamum angustifolium TaxID=2727405 RepID=A0AAW2JW83_9LAMI
MSLNVYWAMAFILPKRIILEIEKRIRSFLWKGNSLMGYLKVAWKVVCRPREEGVKDGGSIWVNSALLPHIEFKIGDGESFSLWHDPWHSLGPLINRFSRGPGLTNTSFSAKPSLVIAEGEWRWSPIPDMECLEIIHLLSSIHNGKARGYFHYKTCLRHIPEPWA